MGKISSTYWCCEGVVNLSEKDRSDEGKQGRSVCQNAEEIARLLGGFLLDLPASGMLLALEQELSK
jgi:hypothetical protein